MNKILKDKGCRPQNVLFRIANENKKGGFHLRETKKKISKSRGIAFLGKGQEGTVYIGCPDPDCKTQVAIKQSSFVEPLKKEYTILKKITPLAPKHIVKPYAFYECDGGSRGVLYLEYIDGKSLFHQAPKLTVDQYRTIIKKVIKTLYTVLEKYPKFRHYDLHLNNIFVDSRHRPVIADLGFASMGEGDRKELPEFGIGPGSDYRYDVHLFLNSLYGIPSLPKEVRAFIDDLIPAEYLGSKDTPKIKNYRLRLGVGHCALPSIRDILAHPFFFPTVNKKQQRMVNFTNKNNSLPPMPRGWLLSNIKSFNKRTLKRVPPRRSPPKLKKSPPKAAAKTPPKLKLMTFAGPARVTHRNIGGGYVVRPTGKPVPVVRQFVNNVERDFKNIFGVTMNEFHAIERAGDRNLAALGSKLRTNAARITGVRPAAKKLNGSPPKATHAAAAKSPPPKATQAAAAASPPKRKPKCPKGFHRVPPKTGECVPKARGLTPRQRSPSRSPSRSPPKPKTHAETQAQRFLHAARAARAAVNANRQARGGGYVRPAMKKK